jgi:hypothetical protein
MSKIENFFLSLDSMMCRIFMGLPLFCEARLAGFLTMMKKYFILIPGLLLSSCATSYESLYSYNEILIINRSRELIQDVTISAGEISTGETNRTFSCGNIAPRGICSDKFPPRRYMKSPIRIGWVFGNTSGQSNEFVLEVPATFSTEIPLRGVLEISPQGSISAYFQQDTPAI